MSLIVSCNKQKTLFRQLSSSHTHIDFNNYIVENDSFNILDISNIYNGGGVGVGDFNNDGLEDVYFTGNVAANKLYLNNGNFEFQDITEAAGVTGNGKWCRGIAVVDINNDGLPDIYVSATILNTAEERENILYINQGNDKNGIPHFKDQAKEYGLNDTTHTTQAAFFDYDNDGDLDVYLLVNNIPPGVYPNRFGPIHKDGSGPSNGRLYRNDWNDSLQHPVFTDVSRQSGIMIEGYGHGVTITDINRDGWKDIFVTNDYLSNNILYINNKDGTFTDELSAYFKHTSANSMGNDVADINNDGLMDIVELDMDPEDNYRKKTMLNPISYHTYQNSDFWGYEYQYVRNTIQLNQGPRVNADDSIGEPVFGDVGFFTGTAETDWSWTPLVTDFDNDGFKDIIVTNGFPRDITDHDFIAFRNESYSVASKEYMLGQIPQVKLRNYAFRNNGNVTFDNATNNWGLTTSSFSNGATYADLDNDGDMDIIVNNINDEAFIYENTTNWKDKVAANYLEIKFKGDKNNVDGLGAWVEIYYNKDQKQVYENSPYRGYLSSIDIRAFFGLGNVSLVDSVIIRWPGNKKQILTNVKSNQLLLVDIKNANLQDSWNKETFTKNALFSDLTTSSGINYLHRETDFIDFDRERLLPHKLSQYGPGLAAGDIDGNGLDDIYIGRSSNIPGKFFLQQKDGKFIMKDPPATKDADIKRSENMGVLLFDADNDGDLDLYCASGSNEFPANTRTYGDHFLINDGKGNFTFDSTALPENYTSKSCVKAVDFDNDGDLDLFIGGRCLPGKYPLPVSSFVYRNDSKNGRVKFIDITAEAAKGLQNIGMVCDAVWTDFDSDGWTDLILVGEWMPITFLKNDHGKLQNVTENSGISDHLGWWNSIAGGDFDNDGDIDYIVGNLGQNSFFRASAENPVNLYAKDFDNNGSVDAILTLFLKDKEGGVEKEYTAMNRDDIISQLPGLRKQFLTYKSFAIADIHQVFPQDQMKGALVLHANDFRSCYMENTGNGKFKLHPLPDPAQMAPLNGMVVDDFNNDGNLDVAICGNDYGNEVSNGRYDAMNGLVLIGDGKGNFSAQTIVQSGLFVPGDAKALVKLRGPDNNYLLAASQNRGSMKIFRHNARGRFVRLQPTDKTIFVTLNNGKKRKEELYFGNSFLSQSATFLYLDYDVKLVEIKDHKGAIRTIGPE